MSNPEYEHALARIVASAVRRRVRLDVAAADRAAIELSNQDDDPLVERTARVNYAAYRRARGVHVCLREAIYREMCKRPECNCIPF